MSPVLLCWLGDVMVAVDALEVSGVNLESDAPTVDVAHALGLPPAPAGHRHRLRCGAADLVLGRRVSVQDATFDVFPDFLSNVPYVRGVIHRPDGLAWMLDTHALIARSQHDA